MASDADRARAALVRMHTAYPALDVALQSHWPHDLGPCRCQWCEKLRSIKAALPALVAFAESISRDGYVGNELKALADAMEERAR